MSDSLLAILFLLNIQNVMSHPGYWAYVIVGASLTMQGFLVALQSKEVKKRGDKLLIIFFLLSLKDLQYKFFTALAHT